VEPREGRGVGRRQGARVGRLISVPSGPTERAKFLNDNEGLDTTVHLAHDDAGGYGVKGLDVDFTKKVEPRLLRHPALRARKTRKTLASRHRNAYRRGGGPGVGTDSPPMGGRLISKMVRSRFKRRRYWIIMPPFSS
jgi:hypothetical protein